MTYLIPAVLLGALPAASAGVGHTQQTLVAAESTWSTLRIPVCWENPAPDNELGRGWSQDAVERTWESVSDVDFVGWGTCTSADTGSIRVRVEEDGPHVKELGAELAGREDGMVLNFTFAEFSSGCAASEEEREACVRAIAVHEFGHALGFAHEHNRSDRRACDAEPQGTTGTLLLTDYDPDSVMNYCSATWNNGGA